MFQNVYKLQIKTVKKKITIGKKDKADFLELGLYDIDIKIDTGAYTSSIHCHKIKEIEEEGVRYIEFQLLDPNHKDYKYKKFKVKKFKEKKIKSSNGSEEKRYIIKTKILIFNKSYSIELSLSERSEMRFPVLIGRKLLNNKFIVDTSLTNLSYNMKLNVSKH